MYRSRLRADPPNSRDFDDLLSLMADEEEDVAAAAEELGLFTEDALSTAASAHGLRSGRLFCVQRQYFNRSPSRVSREFLKKAGIS